MVNRGRAVSANRAGFVQQKGKSCGRDEEAVQPAGRLSHPSHSMRPPARHRLLTMSLQNPQNNPCYALKTPLVHDCTLGNSIRALCIQNIPAKTDNSESGGWLPKKAAKLQRKEQCSSPESHLIAHSAKTWQLLIKVLPGSSGSMRRTRVDR